MKIAEWAKNSWVFCENLDAIEHSILKLHVYIPIGAFDRYEQAIYQYLKQQVRSGIIPAFKSLNIGGSKTIAKVVGNVNAAFSEDTNVRLTNNPITIYLPEGFHPRLIAELCEEIENRLQHLPICDKNTLSQADILIQPHISMRQTSLEGQYIAVANATKEQLTRLRREVEESKNYQALISALKSKKPEETKREKQQWERIKFILTFLTGSYKYYENSFKSRNIDEQFHAACELFQIDRDKFLKNPQHFWNKRLRKRLKIQLVRLHPDRFNKNFKEKAKKVYQLYSNARDFLIEVVENPRFINFVEKIKQQVGKDLRCQYELADGYEEKHHYYFLMARTDKKYVLKVNWEIEEIQSQTVGSTTSQTSSTASCIQIYKPILKQYKDCEKTITVPGYQAFFLLFMADALPWNFSFSSMHMVLLTENDIESNYSYSCEHRRMTYTGYPILGEPQPWLMKKALSTPEYIGTMGLYKALPMIIEATNNRIINVGRTNVEVLTYIYRNYPEIFYISEKSLKPKEINELINLMIQEPSNIKKMGDQIITGLMKANSKFNNFMIEHSSLFCEILKDSWLESNWSELAVNPLVEKYGVLHSPFFKMLFEELLKENDSVLTILSDNSLKQVSKFIVNGISAQKNPLPQWLLTLVQSEQLRRKNQSSVSDVGKFSKSEAYSLKTSLKDHHLDIKFFVKQNCLNQKQEVLNLLNKETLMWLTTLPEIHWSYHYEIGLALISQNYKEDAQICFAKLVSELASMQTEQKGKEKEVSNPLNSNEDIYSLLGFSKTTLESRLNSIRQQWQKEYIAKLCEDYTKRLNLITKEPSYEFIFEQFKLFAAEEAKKDVYEKFKKEYEVRKNKIIDKIKQGVFDEEVVNFKQDNQHLPEFFRFEYDSSVESLLSNEGNGVMHALLAYQSSTQSAEIFGVSYESDDFYRQFRKLFNVYAYFDQEESFYSSFGIPEEIFSGCNIKQFLPDKMIQLLLTHIDNEFAVFFDGRRQIQRYKKHRDADTSVHKVIDHQNIQSLLGLKRVYCCIGQKKHYEMKIQQAYATLANRILPAINGGTLSPDDLRRYEKIRRFEPSLKHLELEKVVIQIRLQEVFAKIKSSDNLTTVKRFAAQLSLQVYGELQLEDVSHRKLTLRQCKKLKTFLYRFSSEKDAGLIQDIFALIKMSSVLCSFFNIKLSASSTNESDYKRLLKGIDYAISQLSPKMKMLEGPKNIERIEEGKTSTSSAVTKQATAQPTMPTTTLMDDIETEEPLKELDFETFKTQYFLEYKRKRLFKNRNSTMKKCLEKGIIFNMKHVTSYAYNHPKSRTAKVLQALTQGQEMTLPTEDANFKEFKQQYLQKYNNTCFFRRNPRSKMKRYIGKKVISTIEQVNKYAEANPRTRTAVLLSSR